jgi:hypothetical protein
MQELTGPPARKPRHLAAVRHVAGWLAAEHASGQVIGECLDALEASLARVPRSALTTPPPGQAGHEASLGGLQIIHFQDPWSISGSARRGPRSAVQFT